MRRTKRPLLSPSRLRLWLDERAAGRHRKRWSRASRRACALAARLPQSLPQAPPHGGVISDEHGAYGRKRAGLENRCARRRLFERPPKVRGRERCS
jgi:hypothetical protein